MIILPIVEGHGEVEAVPILLRRIAETFLSGVYLDIRKPIRIPRSKLVKADELARAVTLAVRKMQGAGDGRGAVLVLLDGDGEAPCILGPRLLAVAHEHHPDADVVAVVAHLEYETWFVAAAGSLVEHGKLVLQEGETLPEDPEGRSLRKAWVDRHMRDRRSRYSETIDQPRFTNCMDLVACRSRSPSFDKLCRELEKRCARAGDVPDGPG